MSDIERAVCDTFGLDDKVLREKTKCQNISQPRMLAMFLAETHSYGFVGDRRVLWQETALNGYFRSEKSGRLAVGRRTHSLRPRQDVVKDILKNLESTLRVS